MSHRRGLPVATPVPPEVVALAAAHRFRQQQIAGAADAETGRLWGFVRMLGWGRVSGRLTRVARLAMASAARGSQDYTAAAVRGWGEEPDPAGDVDEAAFAFAASDGRPLETLLEQPALEVRSLMAGGVGAGHAHEVGRRHLSRIVVTQVADAARGATGVAIANDRKLKGYVRHLTLPSCARCIILAGQWYRWSDGFARHPQCDCVHVPAAVSAIPSSPREIYDSLDDEGRRKAGWSGLDQRAIDDGADLFQATNYRKELRSVTIAGRPIKATAVGTTRRGLAGKRLGALEKRAGERYRRTARVRLTPEQIYADADRLGLSREETIQILKTHGYIV